MNANAGDMNANVNVNADMNANMNADVDMNVNDARQRVKTERRLEGLTISATFDAVSKRVGKSCLEI